jgi:ketosteroid isomerase-like protein
MSDYDAIRETCFDYCEGYRNKDRDRLEKAFALDVAVMSGYIKNPEGKLNLFSMSMKEAIDDWVAADYTPFDFADGAMLGVDIFSEVGASVLFDFGGKYLESYQLAKIDGEWKIVHKFIVNPAV